jgi:exodeoxyribonuclease VII large subunit
VRALGAVERRVHDYEVVVLVRGGGSWESLQGFNDERVVRALFALPLPSVVGVGHEVDEPLCALVADVAVSTPTAVAEILNGTWEEVDRRASEVRGRVYSAYFSWREQGHDRFLRACQMVRMGIQTLSVKRDAVGVWCARAIMKSRTVAHAERQRMTQSVERMTLQFWKHHEQEKKREHFLTTLITKMGPEAVLARGYACVQYKGKVLTNTQHTPLGARLEVVQKDGILEVRVEGKKPRDYAKKES